MIDAHLTCEQCRHPECHADPATKLCVFCEDGKPCPVELQRRRQLLKPAPVQLAKQSSPAPRKAAKEATMKKRCKCGRGIKVSDDGVLHDKCRHCRIKAGEVDPNAARKQRAGAPSKHGRGRPSKFLQQRARRKLQLPAPPTFSAASNGNGHSKVLVPVQVPEELLDLWWSDRTPEQKAAIAGQHLLSETARVLGRVPAGQAQGGA